MYVYIMCVYVIYVFFVYMCYYTNMKKFMKKYKIMKNANFIKNDFIIVSRETFKKQK